MSLFVIRAFIKMREQLATDAAILKRLAEIDKTPSRPRLSLARPLSKIVAVAFPSARAAPARNRLPPIVSDAAEV